MTAAASPFGPTPENASGLANWINRYLVVERSFDSKLAAALRDAADSVDKELGKLDKDNISTAVKQAQLSLSQGTIRKTMAQLFDGTKGLIESHQSDAAVAATNANLYSQSGVLARIFKDPTDRTQYADSMRQTASRNVQAMMTRVLGKSEKPLSPTVYGTRNLANGLVSRTINNALAQGKSAKDLAKDVRALIDPDLPGGVSYAAKRLGRTEINNAFHAQSIADAQDQPWVDAMEWHLSKTHRETPGDECQQYAERLTFKKSDVPDKPHPNCFSGETLVTAKSIRSVSKRWYDGRFIDVFCAENTPHLSGTPNHPALTKRGWVPLSELRQGDYLAVNPLRHNTSRFSVPNQNCVKTSIEDVFNTFRLSFDVTIKSVPGTTKQFHGDGIVGENVDIVLSNSLLQNSWDSKGFSQGSFFGSGMALLNFFRLSAFNQTLFGIFHSFSSNMRSRSSRLTLCSSHIGSDLLIGPKRVSVEFEHASNLHKGPSSNFGSFFSGFTRGINFVRIESIIERPDGFRGHVYNLSTESGWYTIDHNTDSVVVSNCRCYVTPKVMDYNDFEDDLLSGAFDDHIESTMGKPDVPQAYAVKGSGPSQKQFGEGVPSEPIEPVPITKAVKAQPLSQIANRAQMLVEAKRRYGIDLRGFEFANDETQTAVLNRLEELKKKFPKVNLDTVEVKYLPDSGIYGETVMPKVYNPNHSLPINVSRYWAQKPYAEFQKELTTQTESGRFNPGLYEKDPAGTAFLHEFGHAMHNRIGGPDVVRINGTGDENDIGKALWDAWQADDSKEFGEIATLDDWLKAQLSGYSFQVPATKTGLNVPEAMAEGFAEGEIKGAKATPAIRAIHDFMIKRYRAIT